MILEMEGISIKKHVVFEFDNDHLGNFFIEKFHNDFRRYVLCLKIRCFLFTISNQFLGIFSLLFTIFAVISEKI